MSFQNSSIWLHNGSGSLGNGQMQFDTSVRMDQKRGYQWLMDVSEPELILKKKQAIDAVKDTSEAAVVNSSFWHNVSGPQTGSPAGDYLFYPKPVRSPFVSDKNNPSTSPTFVNIEKGFQNEFGNHSSNCVTMPHVVEDPLSTGQREVEVNKASISENCLPVFVGNSICPGGKAKIISPGADPRTTMNMFPLSAYNSADGMSISADPSFHKMDKNFISVGSASSTSDSSLMFTRQLYDGIDSNVQSVGQAFNRVNYNIGTLGEPYVKDNGNFRPISTTGHENIFLTNPFYNKISEAFASPGSAYNVGDKNIAILSGQQDATVVSLGALDRKENSSIPSMVENSKKVKETSTTISFGGFQDNPEERDQSGKLINSYGALLNQSSAQSSGAGQQVAEHLTANVISAATSRAHNTQKNKEKAKKGPTNNFPTNVKSLLSTGILDGVPVKYVSWSREKNLRGVVKGTGYLCGCQDCNLSRVVNAYEFERHADCKTKHPNNHIYFENGKTIYAVVQELKGTPQELLFEVMQNVSGSPVNQKNFNIWKASYQVATRELQRIYANEEMTARS